MKRYSSSFKTVLRSNIETQAKIRLEKNRVKIGEKQVVARE